MDRAASCHIPRNHADAAANRSLREVRRGLEAYPLLVSTLLLRNAAFIAAFDDAGTEIANGSMLLRDGTIEAIGETSALARSADAVVDCTGMLLMPGLVNTHHHFSQTLTRCVPGAQDVTLFAWLERLYPIWMRLTPEALRIATATAIAELLLSGCTTTADHTYMWPNGCRIDDQIEIAAALGMRFHAARGSMSVGRSAGGLPPDAAVEDERAILRDCERAIAQHHDPARYAMTRIVLAPCSPFSVSETLMRETLQLARSSGVSVHTHLAETTDEQRYCVERFGCRPFELAERLEWIGPDVWFAHAVHVSPAECARIGASRTGIAHCPTSNMRLGSGIAPVRRLLDHDARVALGVDGSASNDASNLLDEARHALLLARVSGDPGAVSARDVLRMGTRAGASVLGRNDIGMLAPGMAADVSGWRLDTLELAGGAVHDPLAALVFCRPARADLVIVNGVIRVRDGSIVDFDLASHVQRHNAIARTMLA